MFFNNEPGFKNWCWNVFMLLIVVPIMLIADLIYPIHMRKKNKEEKTDE